MGIVKRRKQPHLFRDWDQHPQSAERTRSKTRKMFLRPTPTLDRRKLSGPLGALVPQPPAPPNAPNASDGSGAGSEAEDDGAGLQD